MSIFFDFNVGSNRSFRRAVDGDKYDIEVIIDRKHTERLFGNPDIGSLIELSTLSICMIDANKDVIGFMALCDHPNVPGVDPSDWEVWMRNMFQKYYLSGNTLFVHFMYCIDVATDFFLEEAFVSVFRNDAYLLNIVFVVPPGCPDVWILRYQTFKKYNIYKCVPKIHDETQNSIYLYTAMRKEFCPNLKIRRAVEEDNDDIVKILAKSNPRLHELYGNFYISEIIGRHPEINRKVIVADYKDQAVGVMCLNSEINYELLQKTYDLGPLHGLRKATPLEKEKYKRTNTLLHTFGEPIMRGDWNPFYEMSKKHLLEDHEAPLKERQDKRPKTHSKVYFDRNASRKSFDDLYNQYSEDYSEREVVSPSPSITTSRSIINMLEEDTFDYEIVNIDKRLLNIPEVMSSLVLLPNTQRPNHPRATEIQDKTNRRSSFCKAKTVEEIKLRKYSGGPNAFMIELFGFRDDIDNRQGFHLLEAAFEVMKNYDYCIIRVPSKEKSFSLLKNFCFVPAKDKISNNYALYVAHRNSVLGKLRVRRAELMDVPQIAQLLRSLDGKETLWTVEHTILHKNQLQCYVFFSGVDLIGVGILEQTEQIDFIRAKFNLDAHRIHKYHTNQGFNSGLSTLKAVVVYPVFEAHYRFFAREMMRLSGANALIWLTAYRNKWVTHKTNSLAGSMIPLIPRKSEIDCTSVPELRRIRKLSNNVVPFSGWFISKKLTSIPRVNVDTRIVVVGASRTAMAFLNTLLFSDSCTYLFFTNVTLVSPNGLSYAKRSKPIVEMMFPKNRTNSDKFLKSVPYTYYINVVQGTMAELNKRDKYISLSNNGRCYYDLLFLLFGKQYQHPDYLKSVLERDQDIRSGRPPQYIRLDIPQPYVEPVVNYTPANVFIVNSIIDGNKALTFVKSFRRMEMDYTIIIYGATKHAYCCLATLVEMKIPTENIVFIESFPHENIRKTRVSLFCNVYVDKKVSEMLDKLRIKVYRSYYFQNWVTDGDDFVTYVDFLSNSHLLRLKCSALFYYGTRGVNEQAFTAINKSGMAYDGGILIDHEFRTKDPAIYAAGPVTRYNRKYYAENKRQKYYDAYEVGTKLGSQIRNQLDPLFTEVKKETDCVKSSIKSVSFDSSLGSKENDVNESCNRTSTTGNSGNIELVPKVPNFKKPHVLCYTLPGGLEYLEVRSPGKKLPHQYIQSLHYNGSVMETFKGGYFKIHLTNDFIVDGITCLTSDKYSLENFKHLYGLSATVLNNVHLRYTEKKVDNFYEFFRSPWAYFLYHDQNEELFAMVKELLPKGQRQGDTLAEAMRSIGENLSNTSFKFQTRIKIRSSFKRSPHIEAITDYVLEWLSENDVLLPMYLQPWQITGYKHDVDHNPAFRHRKNTIAKIFSKIF